MIMFAGRIRSSSEKVSSRWVLAAGEWELWVVCSNIVGLRLAARRRSRS